MADEKTKLAVIDGETLMDMKLPPTKFCVDTLLPQGLCILGGASKIGKSWWVLDLCVRIAKGEPMWDLKTAGRTTLYLCLEDTLRRVQNRLLCITDEVPPNAFFATCRNAVRRSVRTDTGFCKSTSRHGFCCRGYLSDRAQQQHRHLLRKRL